MRIISPVLFRTTTLLMPFLAMLTAPGSASPIRIFLYSRNAYLSIIEEKSWDDIILPSFLLSCRDPPMQIFNFLFIPPFIYCKINSSVRQISPVIFWLLNVHIPQFVHMSIYCRLSVWYMEISLHALGECFISSSIYCIMTYSCIKGL